MRFRIKRLEADFKHVQQEFEKHRHIRLESTEGFPPERYVFKFNVAGLIPDKNGEVASENIHRAEIFLPLDYPRRPPVCRMLTPVFHPNIDPQKICIGDHWSAGQSLVMLVTRIAEMICYQSYNTKSPLNAKAAAWVENHMEELPLFKGDVST